MPTRFSIFLFLSTVVSITSSHSALAATANAEGFGARIEKARELVLKGERMTAIKTFRELSKEASNGAAAKSSRELMQAWREVAEIFLTDKGQNQASLAESFWMTRPKEATDLLLPLLKLEDGNLNVAKLGARTALRSADCAKAETFTASAELVFPSGLDTKLLRLQVQDCVNGNNAALPALKFPTFVSNGGAADPDMGELETGYRRLAVKDAFRRKDHPAAKAALGFWEGWATTHEDPEYWYWKWRTSSEPSAEASRDRSAARKYLRLCSEMTARRRKKFAMHPELCSFTESVESELKSSEKSGS